MREWITRHYSGFALVIIITIGAAYRFSGLDWGLMDVVVTRRPHPDEWVVYWVFHWFETRHSLNPCPGPTVQCFFDWGSIYLYLSFLTHLILSPLSGSLASHYGTQADSTFISDVLAGRLVSASVSTITIWATYRLGGVVSGKTTGLVAAGIVALSGLLIQLSHFATPDSLAVLSVTLFLWVAVVASKQGDTNWYILCGLCFGVAIGTEYHLILLAIPLLTAWYLSTRRRLAALLLALGLASLTYLVTNAYSIVDLPAFLTATAHTLRTRTVESGVQYQGRFDSYGPAWLYVVRFPLWYGAGAPLAVLLSAGFLFALWRRSRPFLVPLAWIIPYGLLVTFSSAKFMRYSAPLFPALAVLAASLVITILRTRASWGRPVTIILLGASICYTLLYDTAYVGLFSGTDTRIMTTHWLHDHLATGSRIWFEAQPDGLLNLPYFAASVGFKPCYANFDPETLDSRASVVILDRYDVEEHSGVDLERVLRFRQTVEGSPTFRLVRRFYSTPSFLGLSFSLDGSPHDWRYPAHDISIYRRSDHVRPVNSC